ncbi:sphingomyelin phosphodiesterase 2 isoform X2 [Vulpes vulpes]|uniref:sphingomyelin phosphodiesterase n=1 Tax=Vulpes vulpes TaxID=9627 RepID=A0ABM4YWK7_VULVU|nr:sphingomyelin phosphodiesterase 2 isoform X2 [Vulpes lagopus]
MKPNFSLRLRIFNLNCWGIPYLSKHRGDRMKRLGDLLNMESFDLALLEEVGGGPGRGGPAGGSPPGRPQAGVRHLPAGVERAGLPAPEAEAAARLPRRALLPEEFTQHVYTLNGYPYMIHHGDWFCGKAVGLLVLHLSGLVLNAYVTHLHAEYNRQKDVYLTHRVAQAWELAQFIHHTSKKADVVLLCGDLNLHPKDLGCRLLKEWTGLHDAYHETRDFKGSEEGCTMVPENCYVSQRELEPFPFGIRIDYVLYKAVSGFYISCKTLRTTTGHDPHSGTPLSDHEALMATLCVRHSPPQHTPDPTQGPAERSRLISVLKEAWTELDLGVAQARWWATFAGYVIGLGLLLLALLCALAAGGGVREVAILLWTPSVGVLLGAGAVYLFHMQEAKGLSRARAELQHVLGRAREAQDLGLESQPALLLGQQERDGGEEQ